MAYELCIAPGEQDSGLDALQKAALLAMSTLGSTHWLTLSSDQVNPPHHVHMEQCRQVQSSGFNTHL